MKKLFIGLCLVILLGPGCGNQGKPSAGGVFKSIDFGETWQAKNLIQKEKNRILTIANADVADLTYNPKNTDQLYIGTVGNGIYSSANGGENWQQIAVNRGQSRAIAVDPKNPSLIYAAVNDSIIKSLDTGKIWKLIYSEPRQAIITEIQVDNYDPKKLYAGTSYGAVIKSQDGGQSWTGIGNFSSRIQKILINPKDTRIIYVATSQSGIFKTNNAGAIWESLEKPLEKFDRGYGFQDLVINLNSPDQLWLATDYGLVATKDGGVTWKEVSLLTPPRSVKIFSVAINYQFPSQLLYATATNLFKSKDGGKTWTSAPLPTSRVPHRLIVDPTNPSVVYLIVLRLE